MPCPSHVLCMLQARADSSTWTRVLKALVRAGQAVPNAALDSLALHSACCARCGPRQAHSPGQGTQSPRPCQTGRLPGWRRPPPQRTQRTQCPCAAPPAPPPACAAGCTCMPSRLGMLCRAALRQRPDPARPCPAQAAAPAKRMCMHGARQHAQLTRSRQRRGPPPGQLQHVLQVEALHGVHEARHLGTQIVSTSGQAQGVSRPSTQPGPPIACCWLRHAGCLKPDCAVLSSRGRPS